MPEYVWLLGLAKTSDWATLLLLTMLLEMLALLLTPSPSVSRPLATVRVPAPETVPTMVDWKLPLGLRLRLLPIQDDVGGAGGRDRFDALGAVHISVVLAAISTLLAAGRLPGRATARYRC